MPFELTASPAIFQELMTNILHGINRFVTAYLDFSANFETIVLVSLSVMRQMFERKVEAIKSLPLLTCVKEVYLLSWLLRSFLKNIRLLLWISLYTKMYVLL